MSARIVSSSSSYYFSSHGSGCNTRNSSRFHLLPPIKLARKIDQTRDFLRSRAKYGIISTPRNVQVKASASPNNPNSSSWQKWLIGLLLTVILPAVGYKGGLLANLKSKIDTAVETVEHVAEMVEDVAEKAEKIVEEVEEKLPDDSKLKETLESFESLAKQAVNEAKKAEDVVNKVKDVEEEIEASLIKAGRDGVFLPSISKIYNNDKLEILKALHLSQTRATEAEKKLRIMFKEKEALSRLLVDESMSLFAHRQWVNLLEFQVLKSEREGQEEESKKWCSAIAAVCLAIAGVGFTIGCRYLF